MVLLGLPLGWLAVITAGVIAYSQAPAAPAPCASPDCFTLAPGQTQTSFQRARQQQSAAEERAMVDFLGWAVLLGAAVHGYPLVTGWRTARRGQPAAISGWAALLWPTGALAYLTGRTAGRQRHRRRAGRELPVTATAAIVAAPDPLAAAVQIASAPFGAPGGHVGWDLNNGNYITARARGAMLVIGPPGSGKTAAVIIPSVIVAPAACVSSSIKGDVMGATAHVRARVGRLWHFDPGGAEQPAPGVTGCRWSPLVSVASWDDARRVASRMAEPARTAETGGSGGGGGGSVHFTDRARDWLEVLLYAAHLDARPIAEVADWGATAGTDETAEAMLAILILAADTGDGGARIAQRQLEGLLATPERERGSILSTLARLLRVYGSETARRLGTDPNFDPVAFVRSTDTLYLTASPERQHEYAPLIAGLLEEIRFAVYARHRAEEQGREPKRPHVTFVLDEANNTPPSRYPQS